MDNYDLTEQEEVEFIHQKRLLKRKAKAYGEYEREQEEQEHGFVQN